jgi:hypothetical protein
MRSRSQAGRRLSCEKHQGQHVQVASPNPIQQEIQDTKRMRTYLSGKSAHGVLLLTMLLATWNVPPLDVKSLIPVSICGPFVVGPVVMRLLLDVNMIWGCERGRQTGTTASTAYREIISVHGRLHIPQRSRSVHHKLNGLKPKPESPLSSSCRAHPNPT